MIIGFDLGNTNIRIGLFKKNGLLPEKVFMTSLDNERLDSGAYLIKQITDYLDKKSIRQPISGLIFSSVNSLYNKYIYQVSDYYALDAIKISTDLELPFKINYSDLYSLGADRITNVAAVVHDFENENSIIVDAGTALTFCVLINGKTFDGGLILPGAGISLEALINKTANLNSVPLIKSDLVVAQDTSHAIQAGVYWGLLGSVENILKKIEENYKESFNIVLTGGYADLISQGLKFKHIYDEYLTMKGLKYLYDFNNKHTNQ